MPPKFKFTKEQITSTALNLTRECGISALTARALSERLGASSMVIFGMFENMSQVQQAVIAAAKSLYAEYVEQGLKATPPFKGVGEKYIQFSLKEPKLFQLLFMNEQETVPRLSGVLPLIDESYDKILASICVDSRVDKSSAERIYRHLWIYCHGIASLCATKMCSFTAEEIGALMTEVYLSLIATVQTGHGTVASGQEQKGNRQ